MASCKNADITVALLAFAAIGLACSRAPFNKAGRTERVIQACESVCARSKHASHHSTALRCLEACRRRVSKAEGGCESSYISLLECLKLGKDKLSDAELLAEFSGNRSSSVCPLEFATVEQCESLCPREGVLSSGEASLPSRPVSSRGASLLFKPVLTDVGVLENHSEEVHRGFFELTHCGCRSCETKKGAPPGAPCDAARVCSEVLLVCDVATTFRKLRLCVDHRCAGVSDANAWTMALDLAYGCRAQHSAQTAP